MTKLEKLIEELCPNGVEYKKTSDLCNDKFWLMPATPKYIDSGIPYLTSKNIKNNKIDFSNVKYISDDDYSIMSKNRMIQRGDLLITMIGTIGEAAFVETDIPFYGQNMYLLRLNKEYIVPMFYFYYLTSSKVKDGLISKKNPSSQGYIKAGSIDNLMIPVPPLEVQSEIVRILDNFTELTAELTTELTARKKQYEYYSTQLLQFDETVEWALLGEIADVTDYVANGSFASLRENVSYKNERDFAALIRTADYSSNFDLDKMVYIDEHAYDFLSKSKLFGGEIIINNIGAGVGTTFRCPNLGIPMSLAPNSVMVKTENDTFYYYWFKSKMGQDAIRKIVGKSAMPKFNKTGLRSIKIPVPTKNTQNIIVDILDRFDTLCNDISQGLPAEIEARQKQYEYYRDKLLTFKEKEV